MCGIFYSEWLRGGFKRISMNYLHNLQKSFAKICHRGPDNSRCLVKNQRFIGFHRLAINDVSAGGDQPFSIKGCHLVCNGEIYNHKQLISKYNLQCTGDSDCEVIIHLYHFFNKNIISTLKELDGVFSLVLVDDEKNVIHIARDPFGVRSLFIGTSSNYVSDVTVASEMKALDHCEMVQQFPAGVVMTLIVEKGVYGNDDNDEFYAAYEPYYTYLTIDHNKSVPYDYNFGNAMLEYDVNSQQMLEARAVNSIRNLFESAVCKRLMSDRPVGCLLSGGLDSSIVTALVSRNHNQKVNTYAVGLKESVDLKWARRVAEYLGTSHHEVCLSETEFLDAIEKTIYQIESYDTTTVRASVGNFLISKYIYDNSNDVVIFCGDMSDEIFGSYRGFTKSPNVHEFEKENIRMVRDVRFFDLLRSDKSISGAGLEARVPFADKTFLECVMNLPPWMKGFGEGSIYQVEKHILRKAFDDLLPHDVIWRRKEAFSDGVSGHERTWVQIIKEYVENHVSDQQFEHIKSSCLHNPPYDKESCYYRMIFDKYFIGKGRAETIPYFWRHPFCQGVLDPSARLLKDIYSSELQGNPESTMNLE